MLVVDRQERRNRRQKYSMIYQILSEEKESKMQKNHLQ
jgi:predicted transcriptional regulator